MKKKDDKSKSGLDGRMSDVEIKIVRKGSKAK